MFECSRDELLTNYRQLARNPAHIPFNTLLITLSSGETLYVPPRSLRSDSPSRAPSPSGYNSDPEAEVHKNRGAGEIDLQSSRLDLSFESLPTTPTTSELDGTPRRKRAAKSANWHDLLKYVYPALAHWPRLTWDQADQLANGHLGHGAVVGRSCSSD